MELAPLRIALLPTQLQLDWPDQRQILDAHLLRRHCRCTECRSRLLRGAQVEPGADLRLLRVEAAGAYGLQLIFSDGHQRGIYPWAYLRALATVA